MPITSKRLSLLVYAAAAVLAATGVVLMLSSSRQQMLAAAADIGETRIIAVRVRSLVVKRQLQRDRIEVSGVVKPIRRVVLSAEVGGQVLELGAREHEPVQDGQVIVRLDDTIRRASVDRAEAAVVRGRSLHRLAQLDLDRFRQLSKDGVTSAAELDRAMSEERATFGAFREAEAILAEARELLKKTIIRAPFDGVLTEFDIEVGDRMEIGRPIGEVIDLSQVEVDIGVTDTELIVLQPGDPVEIKVTVYPGRTFAGTIHRIGSAMDAVTRKFPVEITAANSEGLLLPGMIARTSCEVGGGQPVIRIPRQATLVEFGLTYVFVLDQQDDRVIAQRRRVAVRPVAFRPAELEVTAGLEDGERIAAGNLRELREGLTVEIEERL